MKSSVSQTHAQERECLKAQYPDNYCQHKPSRLCKCIGLFVTNASNLYVFAISLHVRVWDKDKIYRQVNILLPYAATLIWIKWARYIFLYCTRRYRNLTEEIDSTLFHLFSLFLLCSRLNFALLKSTKSS